ncbi:uncharacterized protein LOC119371218 isoform X2 [Jatropha curcas]|uniref:uncharacterized protein LOC119371218 isoform X2 n=1 Tax=Jatropha curcas TaxID=180498 RepID=UPI0018940436|nr:uncharacterized protein LOC119371218 isoform X2 [Jatropha curcas]XP_037496907.1 uncharacterized protein LOC119371218 isoform X2 [Jatropha curcas]
MRRRRLDFPFQSGENPLEIPLLFADIWVQIRDVLNGIVGEGTARALGDFKTSMEAVFEFLRIKVKLDIRKPLKRKKKLIALSGEVYYVRFQYEKVFTICFLCGRIGHTESFCDLRLSKPREELILAWDDSLRAPVRRGARRQSSWIRSFGVADISADWTLSNSTSVLEGDNTVVRNFRNSFYGTSSNLDEGNNSDTMEADFSEEGGVEDVALCISDENKKRQRILPTTHSTAAVSTQNDSASGTISTINQSEKHTSVDPVKQDGRKK